MAARIQAFDWAATNLGPIETWPQSLKTGVQLLLSSRYPQFIWWGPQLINIYNDAYSSVLGKRHPEALGRPAPEIWTDIWGAVGPQAEIVLKEGRSTWNEETLLEMERYGAPEETYFTFSYSPIRDDAGAIGGLFCTCTEETARVLSERRLETLRELGMRTAAEARSLEAACAGAMETLAANPHDLPFALLYLLAEDGRTAHLAGSAQLAGGTPASPLAIALEAGAPAPWPLARVMETGAPELLEQLPAAVGAIPGGPWPEPVRAALVLPIPQMGQSGPAGFLVTGISPRLRFEDRYQGFLELVVGHLGRAISNARAYEAERRRAESLAELDRAKTAFFNNVSHEFRTPLTLMLGPLEEELSRAQDPESRSRLELAQRSSQRLLKLVNTLLDFARIEAGRVRAVYEPVDLAAFTTDLASSFRSLIERAGLRFRVHCPPLPEPVFVDREMWEKIVLNLLSNAFKFTFTGEIEVRLEVSSREVELCVRDTGTGIPEAALPHLFERFHRIEGAQGRSYEGTGIGLALVQELVRLHGGRVGVESALGRGTSFRITLPLGSAHLPAEQVDGGHSPASTAIRTQAYVNEALGWLPDGTFNRTPSPDVAPDLAPEPVRSSPDLRGATVLVADDNTDLRAYLQQLLRDAGYQVRTAVDGQDALDQVRRECPELVLSDVMMPRLDGFGLLREIRHDPRLRVLKVVLLSARAGEEARIQGLEAGADDYLIKPFSARELLARVASQLTLARVRNQLAERDAKLAAIFEQSPASMYLVDAEMRLQQVNARARPVFDSVPNAIGRDFAEVLSQIWPPEVALPLAEQFRHTLRTGETYQVSTFSAQRADLGVQEYYDWEIRRLTTETGAVLGVLCSFTNITEHVLARQALEAALAERSRIETELREQARTIETINHVGQQLAAELDLENLVQALTDAGTELSGAQFGAFFYNVVDMHGESYTLYSLCGAPRSVFERFPMPRNTKIFAPTFAGEGVVRLDDVLADARFGRNPPYQGMPEGHLPVRSYLAVPVVSRSGEVLGGLFFGHAERAVFTEQAEHLIEGIAAQAAVAIDNARLYQQAMNELAERRRVEEALRESKTLLRTIIDTEPECVKLVNRDGTLRDMNHSGLRMIEADSLEQVGGASVYGLIAPEDRDAFQALNEQVFQGETVTLQFQIIGLKGTRRWMETHAVPLRSPEGEVTAHLAVTRDITERKRSVEELRRRAEDLARRDREKDEFLAMLAHELRNPLAPILNATQILQSRANEDPTLQRQAVVIGRQARHMARLLDDLLDVSRITRGKIELRKQAVDLAAAIHQVVESTQPVFAARQHQLLVSLPNGPIGVLADPTRLHQVMENLLSNAARYTEPGGQVTLAVQREGEFAVLRVADTGIGIDPDLLPRVFDLFTQGDRTLARMESGLGIGLTMVKRLVELHGGTVEAASEGRGRGSVFTVRWPLASPPTSPAALNGSGPREGMAAFPVLVVDDNRDAAETLAELVQLWHYPVSAVFDGPSALQAALRENPAVILLDIGMPGMDGYEVARRLREVGSPATLVALTGYGQDEDRRRARQAGFNHHLTKPVDPEALRGLLSQLGAEK